MSTKHMYRANIGTEDFIGLFFFDKKVYYAGDEMECVIKFDQFSDITILWMNVKMRGFFTYKFNPQFCDDPIYEKVLLNHETYHFGKKEGPAIYLDPYTFKIAFKYNFGRDLPTTYSSNNGKVFYYVELNALRSNNRIAKLECPFRLIHRLPLTRDLLPCQGIEKSMMQCCKTYCHLKLSTPQQAYLRGDEICLKVELTNLRHNQCRLRKINFILVRYYEYKIVLNEIVVEDGLFHTEHIFGYIMSNQSIDYGETKTYVGCVKIPDDCLPTYVRKDDDYKFVRITYAIEFRASLRKWLIGLPVTARLPVRICSEIEEGSLRSDEYPFLHFGPHPILPIPLSELEDDTLGGSGRSEPVGGETLLKKKLPTVREDTTEPPPSCNGKQDESLNNDSGGNSPVLQEVAVTIHHSKEDDSSESIAPGGEQQDVVVTIHHSKEVGSDESSSIQSTEKDEEPKNEADTADIKSAGDDVAETPV